MFETVLSIWNYEGVFPIFYFINVLLYSVTTQMGINITCKGLACNVNKVRFIIEMCCAWNCAQTPSMCKGRV
jgi:hypothetical protein